MYILGLKLVRGQTLEEGSSQFPTLSVTIGVDGYFEVTITGSVGGSVDLPGFSV